MTDLFEVININILKRMEKQWSLHVITKLIIKTQVHKRDVLNRILAKIIKIWHFNKFTKKYFILIYSSLNYSKYLFHLNVYNFIYFEFHYGQVGEIELNTVILSFYL